MDDGSPKAAVASAGEARLAASAATGERPSRTSRSAVSDRQDDISRAATSGDRQMVVGAVPVATRAAAAAPHGQTRAAGATSTAARATAAQQKGKATITGRSTIRSHKVAPTGQERC
jgi:diaminopimelate decarboxylase